MKHVKAITSVLILCSTPPHSSFTAHLISTQLVEHCKLSVLRRIQPVSSLHFLRDIRAHSLVILVRDLRPSSTAMGFEHIQRVSCLQLTKPPVYIFSGAQQMVLAILIVLKILRQRQRGSFQKHPFPHAYMVYVRLKTKTSRISVRGGSNAC
jgi:hypothetical protein